MTHSPSRHFPNIVLLLLLFLAPVLADAQQNYAIFAPSFSRDFILSGDNQHPVRQGLEVSMAAIVATDSVELASYRFSWELEKLGAGGVWSLVPLTSSAYSAGEAVGLTVDPTDDFPSAVILNHKGIVRPQQRLDPYASYRLVGRLHRTPFLGSEYVVESPVTSSARRLFHFINTSGTDEPVNVIATLENVAIANPFLLENASDSSKRGFTIDVSANVRRWDEFNLAPVNSSVLFRFDVELREAGGGPAVPLIASSFTASRSIPTYNNSGSVPVPSSTNFTHTLTVRPSAQLDPLKNYEAIVSISHRESNSPTAFYPPGNSVATAPSRLYHFNGNIHFGGNGAILQNFVREPKPAVTPGAGFVSMNLSGLQGHLAGFNNHTFSAASSVGVRLYSDGSLVATSVGSPIPVTPPPFTRDLGVAANVNFERTNMVLHANGLRSGLTVFLPQGMGYATSDRDRALIGTLFFDSVNLDSQLKPSDPKLIFTPASPVYVVEETKPVAIAASEISWNTQNGRFNFPSSGHAVSVRREETAHLAQSLAPPEERVKADNSGYYHFLDGLLDSGFHIETAGDGSAKLSAAFGFGSGHFKTHFPHGSTIEFASAEMVVKSDKVDHGKLYNVKPFQISYNQSCVDSNCGAGNHFGYFEVEAKDLFFTPDGGTTGAGKVADADGGGTLKWGHIEALSALNKPVFAHTIEGFQSGTIHFTGHFASGTGGDYTDFFLGNSGQIADAGPGAIHLAAVSESLEIFRPGSPEDISGQHYYAGLNLEPDSDLDAIATIAGQPVLYSLRSCGKFYLRQSGVTGTVEAVPGTFPEEMTLYGYPFWFKYYGLGFLDNSTSPDRSFTWGGMSVPYPSNTNFDFEGLSFTCLGGLDSARLPDNGLARRLEYWNADIDVGTLRFVTSNSCDPTADAFLALGISAYSTLIDQPIHGIIGIRPNGELIHREFSLAQGLETEIASRLRLPNNLRMAGPADETYRLTAISDAYFNDYASSGEKNTGNGRINFAAKIDVPFFEDLAAHVRTTASKTFNPDAVLHLMGGWEEGGETFFTSTFFDSRNRGTPPGVNDLLYRNDPAASGNPRPYLIHARQTWLNVVPFDYALQWSPALRSFTAFESTQGADLLVVKIDHQLEYLSAENAEISFGAIYEGIPRINLTNFVFNQIDESTGVLQAATEALQAEAVGALQNGLDSMADLLSDQVDALLEDFLSQTVDPVIAELYDQLEEASQTVGSINDWKNAVQNRTARFLIQNTTNQSANLRHAIRQLGNAVGEASSVIHKIDTSLEDVQLALRTIAGEIYRIEGGVSLEPPAIPDPSAVIPGLLTMDGEEFPIVKTLVALLIREISSEIGNELAGMLGDILEEPTAELNRLINEQLGQVRPTLERLREVIDTLDGHIATVREKLGAGGEFTAELQAILAAADSEIVDVTASIQETVESFLIADIPTPDRFVEFTEEELKQRIRQEIRARIREFGFIREYQLVLRQHLYDLDLAIKEGVDTAFAQVNKVLKDLLGEFLAQIDNEINGFLGDLNSVVGAGKLDGFAHINGDALRLLRIDAYLQLMVPDEMEFHGFLQIKQLESDGSGSCSYSGGGVAKEVTAGALGVPVSWLSPGMNIDLEAKFTFADQPVGLGGRIEMVEGEIGFEAFTITDLGAAISFGAMENYIAAKVGMTFQSYALYGGVFFGQTCSIAPLEMVNTEVATVLGNPDPTFSGAYVYGEAHIPVSEVLLGIPATCMFKITAGVGAGAFYFVEGPTYGGQIYLAASGEALCLVGIKGDISLVGAKVADDFRFRGRGRLSGRVGPCPFCIKFGKTILLEYANDKWSFDL